MIDKLKKEYRENIKLKILMYVLVFIILYGVSNASVYYSSLTPFAIGIIFALLYLNFSGYILSIEYVLSQLMARPNINSLIISLNVVLVLIILEYIKDKKNIKFSKWQIFIYATLSQVFFILFNLGNVKDNLALFVAVVLGLLFLYSALCFFDATFHRGFMTGLNLDEKICGAIVLIIFIFGSSSVSIGFINLGLVFVSLFILIGTFIFKNGINIILSVIYGISYSLTSLTPNNISMFVVLSLVALSFKSGFKYLSIISMLLAYLIFGLFFGVGVAYGEFYSLAIGGIIFALIPLKKLYSLVDILMVKNNFIVKDVITKSKRKIIERVDRLSVIFQDMNNVYRCMVKGLLSDNEIIKMLRDEMTRSVCAKCENYNACFRRTGSFVENAIETLITLAYDKGKILLIDLPQHFTSNCIQVNRFVSVLNNMLSSYKDYSTAISNIDTSRILIADQLYGVSKLLETLSSEVDINISYDGRIEDRIKEELSYKNIVCLECAIYEKDISTKEITLIVKTDTIDNNVIEKIVSKISRTKLKIVSIESSEISCASIVRMVTKPNYDIAFGVSSVSKFGNKNCGDNHTIVKIDDGKYMVSICDGMGSGDNANSISKLSISLIENFYKAGFENEIILSSVNKLLSLTEEENFSTIDLCVIDARKNIYDFIKLGATNGYIKRDNGDIEIIESSGLPVGVLEEIKPHITKKLISPMDILIFVSDGIADAFEGKQDLVNLISMSETINPQTLSQEILNHALEFNNGIPEDDMTVLCVRVFEYM